MAIGGDAQVPCEKRCACGPFHNAGKINYPLWWYGDQGILYNFAGGHAIPTSCVFVNHGYWFDGGNDHLLDEQSRKLLSEGTAGLWSSINLDCNNPPPCGSITGTGTRLYLNDGNALPPKISGGLIFHSACCPNLTYLKCYSNSISTLDISALTSLTYLKCSDNLISILDVGILTGLTYLNCYSNSISTLDVSLLTSLSYLHCGNNSLNQAMVDKVLIDVEAYGTNNGTINVSGNTAPSAAGITAAGILTGRGWAVTKDV